MTTLTKRSVGLFLSILLGTSLSHSALAKEAVSVNSLKWMTGTWAGAAGQSTLEENWIAPKDHSMGAFVRMTNETGPSMIELIVIEEETGNLVLHIQQWDPGFEPRTAKPQSMKMVAQGERMVSFEATSEGGMKTLAYESPDESHFNIHIETNQGAKFTIPLSR